MIDRDADIAACFSTADFGIVATFDISGTDTDVTGHFTDATEMINQITGSVEANDATFSCPTSLVEDVTNGMTVTIDGNTYEVKRKHRIGTGISLIYLKTQ